jgi:cell division protease FtsH
MSDRLGALKFGQDSGEVFLGRDMGHQRDYSEEVAREIDEEVRALIESAHDEAWEILVTYRDVLDELVLQLLDRETLSKDEVASVFAAVQKRPSRGTFTGSGKRTPSKRPPVMTPAEIALLGEGDLKAIARSANGGRRVSTKKTPAGAASREATTPREPRRRAPAPRSRRARPGEAPEAGA